MMKHIFTLFLNQKRRYGGMLAEQMLVFFVLLFHPRNIFRLRNCSKKWIVLLKRFENLLW